MEADKRQHCWQILTLAQVSLMKRFWKCSLGAKAYRITHFSDIGFNGNKGLKIGVLPLVTPSLSLRKNKKDGNV